MNELWSAAVLLVLMFGSFGVFWKIIIDVKKSSHVRIDRLDTDMREMKTNCDNRLATYVNKEDLNRLDKDMKDGFNGLTSRIDNLLFAFTNGKTKRK
jgi:hypothetical protein